MSEDKNTKDAITFGEIFENLASIDVSKHVEKKQISPSVQLSYLSWVWAYMTLIKEYPESTVEIEPYYFNDQNGCVQCQDYHPCPMGYMVKVKISVEGYERVEMLPVIDNKNKSIENPTSMDINTAIQRCKVKCMAQFGLGLNLYAGEDLPLIRPEFTKEEYDSAISIFENEENPLAFAAWKQFYNFEKQEAILEKWLEPHKKERTVTAEGKRLAALQKEGHERADLYAKSITEFCDQQDGNGIRELVDELSPMEQKLVWARLTEDQHTIIRELLKGVAA